MIRYVFPKLPGLRTTPFFRVGGIGLANALFVYARAMLLAEDHGLQLIDPAWFSIRSPKHWFSAEKDKRHYGGIFRSVGIHGFRKALLMATAGRIAEDDFSSVDVAAQIVVVHRIVGKGFGPLVGRHDQIRELLLSSLKNRVLANVASFDFSKTVAVHVRRGDYGPARRTPDEWFVNAISSIGKTIPDARFLLFSDGTPEELSQLLSLPKVEPAFFGCSMADIFAISRCRALIGSCSTFSDWGAFLGQIPVLLPASPQFGNFHEDIGNEFVLPPPANDIPYGFLDRVKASFRSVKA